MSKGNPQADGRLGSCRGLRDWREGRSGTLPATWKFALALAVTSYMILMTVTALGATPLSRITLVFLCLLTLVLLLCLMVRFVRLTRSYWEARKGWSETTSWLADEVDRRGEAEEELEWTEAKLRHTSEMLERFRKLSETDGKLTGDALEAADRALKLAEALQHELGEQNLPSLEGQALETTHARISELKEREAQQDGARRQVTVELDRPGRPPLEAYDSAFDWMLAQGEVKDSGEIPLDLMRKAYQRFCEEEGHQTPDKGLWDAFKKAMGRRIDKSNQVAPK